MRVLVTGASGFAGSLLIPRLASDGTDAGAPLAPQRPVGAPGQSRGRRANPDARGARAACAARIDRDRRPLALVSPAGAPRRAHAAARAAIVAALSHAADRRTR